jgi:hypothetical protein
MKNNNSSPSNIEQLDLIFDTYTVTPKKYFVISLALSCSVALVSIFLAGHAFSWLGTPLLITYILWLFWVGPRYLQRSNRSLVAGLGTLSFFIPTIIYFFMLWLGQPGWPLDDFMGDNYADFPAFLSTIAIAAFVYGLLLLRMKLYSSVSVKRHSKKDLFQ